METTDLKWFKTLNKVRIGSIGLLAGILSISLAVLIPAEEPALAVSSSLGLSVNNTTSTSYTSVPFIVNTQNEALIATGKMLPSGLDSRVLNGSGTEVPRMLADNYTLFVGDAPAHVSTPFTLTTGNTPSSTMPIITGVSGNVSTADAPDLELDRHFDISISGYFNTSANGTSQSILYKQGAAKINVSAPSTITFHALNGDDSDNWTMSGAGITSGNHTVRVYTADGLTAYLEVDGTDRATHSLYETNFATVGTVTGGSGMVAASRNTFYAAGRYWVFTQRSSDIWYYTSNASDASSWDTGTQVTADGHTTNMVYFSIYFDGTYVHYGRVDQTADALYYRRGQPQSDGTITWSAGEQTVQAYTNPTSASICVTSDAHAMFAWSDGDTGTSNQVTKNNNTDGTWATAGGYPVTLYSGGFGTADAVSLAAAPSGGTAIAVQRNNTSTPKLRARYYNGATWGAGDESIEDTTASLPFSPTFDNAGNAYILYRDSGSTLKLKVRAPDGSYTSGVSFSVTNGVGNPAYDSVAHIIYLIYSKDGIGVYYRSYVNGTLGAENTLTGAVTDGNGLAIFVRDYSGKIGIASEEGGGAHTLKFGLLSFPWEWNDTANAWWWMTNNTMPYADNVSLSVLGTQELLYRPNNMIYGNALPDVSAIGTHTGTIYWGASTLTVSGAALITLPATNITTNSAVLNGQLLDMAGQASFTTYFDFGLSTSYGSTTSFVIVSTPQLLSANVSGLFPNTTYHFRAVAVSANITLYGGDLSFITQSGPGTGNFQFGGGNARVFRNYITSGDMLFAAEVVNTYPPYYPNQSPKEFFTVQLIGTDNTTILGATPQQDWGDKPIGIYLNPTQAAGITDHGAYYIRMQANFSSNVSVQYQLQDSDWKGYDLTKLDDWCIYVALGMQTYYNGAGYVTVLTDRKLAITDAVGGYFTAGIAGIGQIRPNLFTTSQQNAVFTAGVSGLPADNATGYVGFVGTTIANDAGVLGTPLGLTGRDMLAAGMAAAMLGVIMLGTSAMGGFGALGLFLIAVPILWLGTYFQVVGVQWVMILTVVFGFLAIRQFIIKTT